MIVHFTPLVRISVQTIPKKGTFFFPAENRLIFFFLQFFYLFPLFFLHENAAEKGRKFEGFFNFFFKILNKIRSGTGKIDNRDFCFDFKCRTTGKSYQLGDGATGQCFFSQTVQVCFGVSNLILHLPSNKLCSCD